MKQNTSVIIGVCGGIAAYKSAELTRLLRKAGARTRVMMTRAARRFITPLTLQALSGHAVALALWEEAAEGAAAMGHIELARWADCVVIAPATADFLARLAAGRANDTPTAVCLATAAPIYVCPAMNAHMWANAATQDNCARLLARGVHFLGPAQGELACGEIGAGRMWEPAQIVAALCAEHSALAGRRVMVTAGPTREALDPVRYLSNHSSGRMGYAVAQAAFAAGAAVTLVSGPTQLSPPPGVAVRWVESAQDLLNAVMAEIAGMDIFISVAAVADYRPVQRAVQKIKKTGTGLCLELELTPDILAAVASLPNPPFTVGFAAETEALEAHALDKLRRKKLDLIAANRVDIAGLGFGSERNALSLLWEGGSEILPATDKRTLASQLITRVATQFSAQPRAGSRNL